ncbi:DnaJ domain-containing protein [Polychytrium aggregatum]|uniref:DnaJ domain-containing protein n=1 Tax=Polychytrium aggregatum TaxID=110093 RepID=UPI0022FF4519|nr:DnaJ domain-containing protein [Polychytrium aggregatum]KAI9205738.1 DnaJ domain-containing protein [Polychytrium aggregatum]
MCAMAVAQSDYYKVLDLDRSASDEEIRRAYRKMALKFHPEKNKSPEAIDLFYRIAESYDVLSNAQRRAIYDQYGPDGLTNGIPTREGFDGYPGGYQPPTDPLVVFSSFFGGTNPFSDFFSIHTDPARPLTTSNIKNPPESSDKLGRLFGQKFGGLHGMNKGSVGLGAGPVQAPPIESFLDVTLEELYTGAVKRVKIKRKVLNDDGMTTRVEEKLLSIGIEKGLKNGTRVAFPQLGDQGGNMIPADLVFIIREKPHPVFTRNGDNLEYTSDIPLIKALIGSVVEIKTLDKRILKIPITQVVSPESVIEVSKEGMPIYKSVSEEQGKLLIKFKITFPTYFSESQKKLLHQAFVQQ